jgi:hypothetical protein
LSKPKPKEGSVKLEWAGFKKNCDRKAIKPSKFNYIQTKAKDLILIDHISTDVSSKGSVKETVFRKDNNDS